MDCVQKMNLPIAVVFSLVAWLASIATTTAAQRPHQAGGGPVEMSSMVITFYNSEYQPMYSPLSQCELLLRRAAKHGGRRIQFVPTHYWYDKDNEQYAANTCHPDNWSLQNKVDYFCQKHEWNSECRPFNDQSLATFKNGFKHCLSVASQLFDEIMVAPHLDDGLKRGKWRNMLHFDPLWKDPYGHSYWSIMLKPILEAANEVLPAGKQFWFAVEGEMGGTIMTYPAQYLKVFKAIRDEWRSPAKLHVGFTVNHAYIMGHVTRGPGIPVLPHTRMAPYDGGFGPVLPFEQWPNHAEAKSNLPYIKQMIDASDFIGVSNYARADDGNTVRPSHIESSTRKISEEFAALGINLKQALKNKVFMFNEFGLGGGMSECGDVPGTDSRIGLFSWLGVTTPYTPENDPFKKSPAVKEYVIKWYKAALSLLKAGGAEFPVHHSYIWNCVSWDVQGIHTASALWNTDVNQGSWPVEHGFAVQEVIDMVKQHNKEVTGRSEKSQARKQQRSKTAAAKKATIKKPVVRKPAAKQVKHEKTT